MLLQNLGWLDSFAHYSNIAAWLVKKATALKDSFTAGGKLEDEDLSIEQRAMKHGFTFASHEVPTEDSYLLTVHQISNKDHPKDAPVVLLQHGITDSADAWLEVGARSPAFQLVNAGFNVFLGNNRGNKYSKKHQFLDPEKDAAKFFNYTFYDEGKMDQPAQIDFVRKFTNQNKIAYVGHSMGTTQMFSALSKNHGNLNNKLTTFIALAPVASLRYQDSADEKMGLREFIKEAKRLCKVNKIYQLSSKIVPVITELMSPISFMLPDDKTLE